MARELPFFKFFVSEWNDGDIAACSMESQGLFINLCSFYWSRMGCVGIANAKRKYSECNASAWRELISAGIIKVNGDDISISFLDEQFGEKKKTSAKNRKSALERWNKDANALPTHSERIANGMPLREEKTREEKEKEFNSLSIEVNTFLQRKISNTADVRAMVQQWQEEGHTDILNQLKAMKAVYQQRDLTFPTKIETLTESFIAADWILKLKELDPEVKAENIAKEKRNGKQRIEPDTIGTSEPGSLG